MHESVLKSWAKYTEPFEGRVYCMYQDILGLITTGCGNLIDGSKSKMPAPWAPALALPWKHADGTPATGDEIRAAWLALKAQPKLAKRHWKYAAALNDLRLSDEDIDALVAVVLKRNEIQLKKAFPDWDNWPADAQLGALSMAWACGSGFPRIFKRFTASANAGRWEAAAVECKISEVSTRPDGTKVPNPGTIPRNRANALCFRNAATVVENDMPRGQLWWPSEAP
jgi:GH24 family phage-related lysozyme (muramidase)